jgi:hypothetical protein
MHTKGDRRDAGLKMGWTKPLPGAWPMGGAGKSGGLRTKLLWSAAVELESPQIYAANCRIPSPAAVRSKRLLRLRIFITAVITMQYNAYHKY